MGPATVTKNGGLDIGPHPHSGLQTVTWLVSGEAVHHDSLGSEQLLKPGQLNLMTAGRGVSHSEEGTSQYEGTMQGIQLWIAQPEATRFADPAFEHHHDLAVVETPSLSTTILLGSFEGVTSAARRDSELVGLELVLRSSSTLPLRPDFEYCLIVLEGALILNDTVLVPGQLGYLAPGDDELFVDVEGPTRAMLLGGVPFESPILMWWNFVARTREEIDDAYESWSINDGRYGEVASQLARISSPVPFWRS
jgi:hypothetical protein